jgi:hypothetical protein
MQRYSAIVGVYWQKCGFLPDRAYLRFKGDWLEHMEQCLRVLPVHQQRVVVLDIGITATLVVN